MFARRTINRLISENPFACKAKKKSQADSFRARLIIAQGSQVAYILDSELKECQTSVIFSTDTRGVA